MKKLNFKSTLVSSLLIAATSFLLCSCNTVKGFGQDMQQGGQALQQAAVKNQ
jgi:predicted small secreted protein